MTSNTRTKRFDLFISGLFAGIAAVNQDGFQALECLLFIHGARLPMTVADCLKKPGQLVNGLMWNASGLEDRFELSRRHEVFPLDSFFLLHGQAHLTIAVDDHIFETHAFDERLSGPLCLQSQELERTCLAGRYEHPHR